MQRRLSLVTPELSRLAAFYEDQWAANNQLSRGQLPVSGYSSHWTP